jgi:hypothetical protein
MSLWRTEGMPGYRQSVGLRWLQCARPHQAGTAVALKKDLRHYADAFMPTVAKPMIEFVLPTAAAERQAETRPDAATATFSSVAA